MIVRDAGDRWDIVLQPDHAELSAQFARAWGNDAFDPPAPRDPVVVATARHDDGWAIWERSPTLLHTGADARPRNFLDVQIPLHVAFYRAHIAAIGEEDAYAELLVSMHGRGIYNGRYGTDTNLRLSFAADEQEAIDAFAAEQEARQATLRAQLAPDEEELWRNYRLLQVYDRLSLHFCMRDAAVEPLALAPVPVAHDAPDGELRGEPDGQGRLRLAPFPFAQDPMRFTLRRHSVAKAAWPDHASFREAFSTTPAQEVEIVVASG
jgi:hypothetical protein